jgi:oligopeptide/dipeptide ABC transporter ATP-binding protein
MTPASPPPLLAARNVTQRYALGGFQRRHEIVAVNDVSLEIKPGETVGIVGESGSGKTTLGRLLLGIEAPSQGEVLFRGVPLLQLDQTGRREFRHSVGAVFQNPYSSLDPRMRVWQIVTEQLFIERAGDEAVRRARAARLLDRVGLSEALSDRYPHQLSGGQRQRVAIARALVSEPDLIVLDEATSALDVSIQAQIMNLLIDLQESVGVAYLFIAHNLSLVRHLCHRMLVMCYGQALEEGTSTAIFAQPAHPYTDSLLKASNLSRGQMQAWDELADAAGREAAAAACLYSDRCRRATNICREVDPPQVRIGLEQSALCHHPLVEPSEIKSR